MKRRFNFLKRRFVKFFRRFAALKQPFDITHCILQEYQVSFQE